MATVPTPATAVSGLGATAAQFNTLRDSINLLLDPPRAHAGASAAQTIGNGSLVALTFGTEVEDNDAMFTPGGSVMTVKTAGRFLVSAQVNFTSNATGGRVMFIRKNSGEVVRAANLGSASGVLSVAAVTRFAVNDTVSVIVLQSSGGNLDTDITVPVFLSVQWLGK